MELLAPVGGFPAFEAALEQGADAVYVGAPGLNARSLAKDFTYGEIGFMIAQAHRAGKKLYVAMNSLVKEAEIALAIEALAAFSHLKPDALIIQDLGLFYLARTYFPELTLHASTLLSVHNSLAATQLARMGCERVVLARELTLAEIAAIQRASGVELEIFIHGAMCFSYSGLCLFSSLHGGKSSLRGQCVQPCRRRYTWQHIKGKTAGTAAASQGYPFSMNDLCGIDLLPEFQQAGVTSLKIEGRLKNAEYVRKTVKAYRLALDTMTLAEPERREALEQAHHLLDEAMGRKRAPGYFLGAHPATAVSPDITGASGLPVGKVLGVRQAAGNNQEQLTVNLQHAISLGDRLRFHDESTGERVSFTLRTLVAKGVALRHATPGSRVEMGLPPGSGKNLGKSSRGELFRVDVSSRREAEREAKTRRLELSRAKYVPDRQRIERILAQLYPSGQQEGTRRVPQRGRAKQVPAKPALLAPWMRLRSPRDLGQTLPLRPAKIILPLNRESCAAKGAGSGKRRKKSQDVVWSLPPVIQEADLSWYHHEVAQLVESGQLEFQLGHVTQLGLFVSPTGELLDRELRLYGDYTFNILNMLSLQLISELGFSGVQFALDTDQKTLTAALKNFSRRKMAGKKRRLAVGLLVYGRPPLFTSRLAAPHLVGGTLFTSPMSEHFQAENRDGLTLVRSRLTFSLLQWQEELRQQGLDYVVVDLSTGPLPQESSTLAALLQNRGERRQLRAGNFSGTLL